MLSMSENSFNSLLATPAWLRLVGVGLLLVPLWLAIGWAVSLP